MRNVDAYLTARCDNAPGVDNWCIQVA